MVEYKRQFQIKRKKKNLNLSKKTDFDEVKEIFSSVRNLEENDKVEAELNNKNVSRMPTKHFLQRTTLY